MRRAPTLQPLTLNGRGLAMLVGTLALLGLAIGMVAWYGVA